MIKQLDPLDLKLNGRHLIEASAGTGKTYNITRIYARLLIEKQLSVKRILVMTFTEAATEEIRERIESFLDELIQNWFEQPCEFSLSLQSRVDAKKAYALLEIAKLELDLAAIYTIHGFCQRVISRYGLFMSIAQNTQLQTDFSKIMRTCVADCLLKLRKDEHTYRQLQSGGWNNPDKFIGEFSSLLLSDSKINVIDKAHFVKSQLRLFNQVWQDLSEARHALQKLIFEHEDVLASGLADNVKNRQKVREEIDAVHAWLEQALLMPVETGEETVLQWLNKSINNDAIIHKAFTALLGTRRKNAIVKKNPASASLLLFKYAQDIDSLIRQVGVDPDVKKGLIQQFTLVDGNEAFYQLIELVRERLQQHKEKYKIIGFDDLIANVAKAMQASDESLLQSLREEYPVALVDEFQDTDEHQYSILDRLYPALKKPLQTDADKLMLVMIGDPKQAIYSFRGGDIFTYLQAKNHADFVWNMGVNYRSSAAVVNTYNRIFYGEDISDDSPSNSPMSLFDYEIAYHCISTPKKHSKAMALIDSDKTKTDAAFEFICAQSSRVLGLDTAGRNRKVETPIKFQQYQILNSCAREIQRLLSSCYISLESNNQAIQPSDIAILVRSSNQAKMVKRVFDEYGLATVALSEKALLFQSKEAANLACLLEAIQHPSKNSIRLALTTGLLCSSAPQNNRSNTNKDENGTGDINITDQLLQNEMHPQWEFVYQRITELATLWKDKNVHALLQEVVQGIDFEGTHLANANNVERSLTNYLHLAEILGAAEIVQRAPLQLLYWLKQQIHAPEKNDASQLRLESDQKLIKIITQHKSKGLEYPIVFLPFANHYYASPNGQYLSFHDKNNQSVEQLGKTLEADRYATKEQLAEDMRLLYVSLTRPILRCYLGIAGSLSANNSALQRALGITIDSKEEYENLGQWMQQQLQHSLKNLGGIVNCVQATTLDHKESKVNWITQKEQVELGQVLTMARYIDDSWQVTSFSRLANAFEASRPSARFRHESVANISLTSPLLSEHQIETSRDTEELQLQSNHYSSYSQNTNQISHRSASKLEIACYAFTFPKGPDAGNFLHDLLEALNFDELKDMQKSGDELKTLAQQLGVLQVNREKIDFARLYDWFETILSTPLNNDDTLLLGHLLANQVLKESEFYFPIESVDIRAIAKFVDRYRRRLLNINASTEANSQGQNQAINDAMLIEFSKQIKGAMHGFIDLIFEFNGQYFVCDYKSNFLGLELQDYGRTILTEDIIHHHYDLQYLIYSLALHRYLQHKVPDYSYEKHVGGVYYLYLRGMNGVNNQSGVYFDKLPLSSIQALDTLFSCIKQSSELE